MKGNQAIVALKKALLAMPVSVAHDAARAGSGELTRLVRQSFAARQSVYGDPYPTGKDGRQLTMVLTGETRDGLGFEAIGTTVRCVLPGSYTKYLIGKYSILPNGTIPASWSRALDVVVAKAVSDHVARLGAA
jgi:hypothetical protein